MTAPTITRNDSTPLIVRMVAIHAVGVAVLVAIPLTILAVIAGSALTVVVALLVSLLVGVAVTAWRLRQLDRRLAERFGATPIATGTEPRLETVIESVSMATGISPPDMYRIDSDAVNVIGWGFGDGPAKLAVTSGLLQNVDRVELEALLAHQAVALAYRPVDAITLGASLFGGFASGGFAERAARLINGGVDPRAVVLADIEGATATRYPPGMTSALETVASSSTVVESIPVSFVALCFASPASDPGPFGIHPPLADRIDLMREW